MNALEPETRNQQIGGTHYSSHTIQPWDVIEEYELNFWLGNVIKYVCRHQEKDGLKDLEKAAHYLLHEIARQRRRLGQ